MSADRTREHEATMHERRDDPHRDHSLDDVLRAAALSYDADSDVAPRLAAAGRGHVAEKILELASEHDIAIRRDPTLMSVLEALDVGAEIPPELYTVIAEVLAWAYAADRAASHEARRYPRAA